MMVGEGLYAVILGRGGAYLESTKCILCVYSL